MHLIFVERRFFRRNKIERSVESNHGFVGLHLSANQSIPFHSRALNSRVEQILHFLNSNIAPRNSRATTRCRLQSWRGGGSRRAASCNAVDCHTI